MHVSCRALPRGKSFAVWLSAGLLVVIALVGLLALAQPAAAGPSDPTMGLDELGTKLASGPLDGYMLTTMKGYTVEPIAVKVESLVEYSWGTLILFDSTASEIVDNGGIAAGMSGSPIYVDDGGTDKLIGAVSYGDNFTLQGMGLATPIEYMAATESTFLPASLSSVSPPKAGTYQIEQPARVGGTTVRSVAIAGSVSDGKDVAATAAADESVMVPLGLIEIGGLQPQSKAFHKLATELAAKTGLTVKAAPGSSAWAGAPSPALEAGSPCAVVYSLGDIWWGAAGTVTYVDGTVAMLFGHPLDWSGATNAALTGGYVSGVWPDSMEPYKLIAVRDVKGTATQDRYWGVGARLDQTPQMFPVTTHAQFPSEGIAVDDSSSVSPWFVDHLDYSAPADIIQEAMMDQGDASEYSGSAQTTTTIVVGDNAGHTYTIKRDNLWNSSWVNDTATGDVTSAIRQILTDPDGVLNAHIVSVDVQATLSPTQRTGRIVKVELPNGLQTGHNTVKIDYYRYGSSELQSVETTLTIPKGDGVSGRLSVIPGRWGSSGGLCCWCCCCGGGCGDNSNSSSDSALQTLADLVDQINSAPANSDVVLAFQPNSSSADGSTAAEIDVTVPVGNVVSNSFSQATAQVHVMVHPKSVKYGRGTAVVGYVRSDDDIGVSLYRRDAGSSHRVSLTKVTAVAKHGVAMFAAAVPNLKHNCALIAQSAATDSQLPGTASVKVKVHALVGLRCASNGNIHVSVKPADASGKVRLQRKVGTHWKMLATVSVKKGTATYRLPKGSYTVRARYLGSTRCAAGTSPSVQAVVR